MHWYELDNNNRLANRRDLQISIDQNRFTLIPKAEARPFLMDWNRDGIEDLVVVLQVFDKTVVPRPQNYSHKLFVKLGSQSQRSDIEASLKSNQQAVTNQQMFAPEGGADLVVNLEPFDFQNGIEDRWAKMHSQRWRIIAEFAFDDLDAQRIYEPNYQYPVIAIATADFDQDGD
ncbi:MAG: hypothetical protein AAF623_22020, partial [Planctomycetota bacterium]